MTQPISSLSVGSKVKYGRHQVNEENPQEVIWLIADKDHYKDSNNPNICDHVTLISEGIIDLRAFDAKEPNNDDTNRQSNGNNRYRDSNARQWLNKSEEDWFEKTHDDDEPPTDAGTNNYGTGYDGRPGFLVHFTNAELEALVDTTITVAKNTVTDEGGTETVTDKIFLASVTEVGLANEPGGAEGSKLAIFSDDDSRKCKLTQQAFDNTKSSSKPSTINDTWHYWLRSPYSTYSCRVRIVSAGGTLNYSGAYFGYYGVRPLCNLKSEILVSDTPDSDGAYIMMNVISNDLQKVSDTEFTWTVEIVGEHTNIKSQLHVYDDENNLVAQGSIKTGIGTKTDMIIPTAPGDFKAKVKLWSNITEENWSNEIEYEITVIPYILTLDRNIDIKAGDKLEKLKFNAKVNNKNLSFKSIDSEKIIFEGEELDTNKVDLEIEGKDGKIDNIAYTII